jgi:hypothetical protein
VEGGRVTDPQEEEAQARLERIVWRGVTVILVAIFSPIVIGFVVGLASPGFMMGWRHGYAFVAGEEYAAAPATNSDSGPVITLTPPRRDAAKASPDADSATSDGSTKDLPARAAKP